MHISRQERTYFQRLCRRVAFDRFLARLVAAPVGDLILGAVTQWNCALSLRDGCRHRRRDPGALRDLTTREWLAFAEIPAPSVTMIGREQQLAEKIHAYTVPRPILNSRVRDLVDLYLLVASGSLDASLCAEALRRTFERRNTHEVPGELVPPPADWERPFRVLAEECRIEIGYRQAFETLLGFWAAL